MTDPSLQNRYRECVRMLYSIAPSFQRVGVSGYHPGLESMTDFARFLGNPHKSLRTIHIAGTNGKGSVAHMLASALAFRYPGSSGTVHLAASGGFPGKNQDRQLPKGA